MSAPLVSLEAFEHILAGDADPFQSENDGFSLQRLGFVENYLKGSMRVALRHTVGDVSDYGFAISPYGVFENSHRFWRTGEASEHAHDSSTPPCWVGLDKPLVFSNDIQFMQGAQPRVTARSVIWLDRFNYDPVVGGEPPFVFWAIQPFVGVSKMSLRTEERKVCVDIRFLAHSARARCRRKIETAAHRIDDCPCLG